MLMATYSASGQRPSARALEELEALGVVAGGRIADDAADIVEVMTDARLVISVDRRTADLPFRSTIWERNGTAVWGRPVNGDVFELRAIDPIQLPLLLAQLTDVGRRPLPPFSGALLVRVEPLHAALTSHHDQETAFGILVASGLDPLWADRLLIAHDHRRAEWTISSVWTDPTGTHGVHETTVLDAGPAGFWHLHRTEDGTTVRYTVGSLESVMRSVRRCVPDWCTAVA